MGNTSEGTYQGLRTRGFIEVAPIRKAVMRRVQEGYSFTRIAEDLGWYIKRGDGTVRGDESRLRRRLGMRIDVGRPRVSRYINRDLAVEVIRAADIDPVDVGL